LDFVLFLDMTETFLNESVQQFNLNVERWLDGKDLINVVDKG